MAYLFLEWRIPLISECSPTCICSSYIFFVWTVKPTPGGGGHFHINLYGACRFSGYYFSALIPELGMKQNVSQCNLVELFCLNYKVRLRASRKVIINCQSQPMSRNNSLSGVFQNKILPTDF